MLESKKFNTEIYLLAQLITDVIKPSITRLSVAWLGVTRAKSTT